MLILGPPQRETRQLPTDTGQLRKEVEELASQGKPEKEALREVAHQYGMKKRDLYQMLKRSGN